MRDTVRICTVDPSTDARWDAFVDVHPDGTLYHHSCWKEVVERSFGYMPAYYVLEDSRGALRGAIPFFHVHSRITGDRLVSIPFADFADPLVESEQDLHAMLSKIGSGVLEKPIHYIRIHTRGSRVAMEEHGFRQESVYRNHVLPIDRTSEAIRTSVIDGSRRTNIRKARESGISLMSAGDRRGLDEYYPLYVLTRKRHGLVPLPFSFFGNVWDRLFPRGMAHLVLAKRNGLAIAGILLACYRDTLYALSNSSLEQHLSCRPNDLLWWNAIELAERRNLAFLDFGRTSLENKGLLFFKERWGTIGRDIVHMVLARPGHEGRVKREDLSHGAVSTIIKHTPSIFLRMAGAGLYRHFG